MSSPSVHRRTNVLLWSESQDILDTHNPEGAGGEDELEAVDGRRVGDQRDAECERVPGGDPAFELGERDPDRHQAQDKTGHLPDLYLLDTDQLLGIRRLGEGEIERAEAHLFHEALHTRLDERPDDPPDQEVDAQERHEFGLPPAAEFVRLCEDDGQPRDRRTEFQERLEELDKEIRPIAQFSRNPRCRNIQIYAARSGQSGR